LASASEHCMVSALKVLASASNLMYFIKLRNSVTLAMEILLQSMNKAFFYCVEDSFFCPTRQQTSNYEAISVLPSSEQHLEGYTTLLFGH